MSTTETCQEVSERSTCNGIQGIEKDADICCAKLCTCTCGGQSEANKNLECFVTKIRNGPIEFCSGKEGPTEACALGPPEQLPDSCNVEGVTGIADASGIICCPTGCGMCGGDACGHVPMSWVAPGPDPLTVAGDIPAGTSSSTDYCCSQVDRVTAVCGVDGGKPPCLIETVTTTADTCGIPGITGIALKSESLCCPIGCTACGGEGCGKGSLSVVVPGEGPGQTAAPEGSETKDYCCTTGALERAKTAGVCGENGAVPPCLLEAPTTPVAPEDLAPDTCGVADMSGIADSSGAVCCPQGCPMCGGTGCGQIDMDLVAPTVTGGVPTDAKSTEYCCTETIETGSVYCGVDGGTPPCKIPAPEYQDSCHVEGIEGISDPSRKLCCPLGCGLCTGSGCGSVTPSHLLPAGATVPLDFKSWPYCCDSAFTNETLACGVGVADPPCLIPEGTVFPTDSPSMAPTAAPVAQPTESPPTTESDCSTVTVDIPESASYSGAFVMTETDDSLFLTTDETLLMTYVPAEPVGAGGRARGLTESCGRWVIADTGDDPLVLTEYPQISVEDCATHPADIDPDARWVIQSSNGEAPFGAMSGLVDCFYTTTDAPAMAPSTAPAALKGNAPTGGLNQPVVNTGSATGNDSGDSGLSQGEAIGIGVGVGAAVLLGALAVSRFVKRGR